MNELDLQGALADLRPLAVLTVSRSCAPVARARLDAEYPVLSAESAGSLVWTYDREFRTTWR